MLQPKARLTDEGVCFFLPSLALPTSVTIDPDLVILDMRFARWVKRVPDLCRWARALWKQAGLVAIYTTGDRETAVSLNTAGFSEFPFDHRAIETCVQKCTRPHPETAVCSVDWRLGDAAPALSRTHEIHGLIAPKIDTLVADIIGVLEQHRDKASPDLNRARWLLATLCSLPVPTAWYDSTAAEIGRFTFTKLIDSLGARSRFEEGLGAVAQTLKLLFSELLAEMKKENPRCHPLTTLLKDLANDDEMHAIHILTRDKTSARALDTWLSVAACPGESWLEKTEIYACGSYSPVPIAGLGTVVCGPFPRRYRWLAGASLGNAVHFLAYGHETEIVRQQLEVVYAQNGAEARCRQRDQAVSAMLNCRIDTDTAHESPIASLRLKVPPGETRGTAREGAPAAATSLSGLGDQWTTSQKVVEPSLKREEPTWYADPGDDDPDSEFEVAAADPEVLKTCVLITVRSCADGRGTVVLPRDAAIDCVRLSVDEELRRVSAGDLKQGDVILLLGATKRAGVFETIVDLAERQPSMEYLAAFRRQWAVAIRSLAVRYASRHSVDFSRLLADLRREGASIESEAAVRLWVHGEIIGPETIESIRAVGALANHPTIARQAKDFQRAFRKIRGLRRGIGHRLANLIRKSFANLALGETVHRSDVLEKRLGIAFEEILDTIDIAEVLVVGDPSDSSGARCIGSFMRAA